MQKTRKLLRFLYENESPSTVWWSDDLRSTNQLMRIQRKNARKQEKIFLPVNSPLGGPKKSVLGVKRNYDVITSRRFFWVESVVLCLLYAWCEFGDNRTRNMVTAVLKSQFLSKFRHFFANISRTAGLIFNR